MWIHCKYLQIENYNSGVIITKKTNQETLKLKSRDIIKLLKNDGWYEVRTKGSHHQFKHPTKPGLVTVPHPKSDIPTGTRKNIFKQARLEE